MTLTTESVRAVVLDALAGTPGLMAGSREEDGAVVARERGVTDGPWVSLAIRYGAPTSQRQQQRLLVRGTLGLHVLTPPHPGCGDCCPASRWQCSCGEVLRDVVAARLHVADAVLAVLDE